MKLNIKLFRGIALGLALLGGTAGKMLAGDTLRVSGTVYSAVSRQPLQNVVITSPELSSSIMTIDDGKFSLTLNNRSCPLQFTRPGYVGKTVVFGKQNDMQIFLMPETVPFYTSSYSGLQGPEYVAQRLGSGRVLGAKDVYGGYAVPEEALPGRIAGLRILSKGGMPGEGALLQLRGVRSLRAGNTPLIVVDGMPYFPDEEVSQVIGGYSKSMLTLLNLNDISSISLLKGFDASPFGSVGSNGVLMIETEKPRATDTRVRFHTTEGISVMDKRIPSMNADAFKDYIQDIGDSYINNRNQLVEYFPFLKDDPDYHYNYIYAHDTDWQDEVYAPAFHTENTLRVTGGDAIASYNLSAGLLSRQGAIEHTKQTRYYTRLNSGINISQRLKLSASLGFDYSGSDLAEQGLIAQTNPLLAALKQSPLLGIYEQNTDGVNMPNYNPTVSSGRAYRYFGISNPSALVSDVDARSDQYNILLNLGFDYRLTSGLSVDGLLGIYYNYTRENIFIPGKSSGTIAPLFDGEAENTTRFGVGENFDFYGRVNLRYRKALNYRHTVGVNAGYQVSTTRYDFDCGSGSNTTSDFFTTLGSASEKIAVTGRLDRWNWMNGYVSGEYRYANWLRAGATLTVDASSASGESARRIYLYPSAALSFALHETGLLKRSLWIGQLTLRGEYSCSGNSRFSSEYSRYTYRSVPYLNIAGTVRGNLPNPKLKPEKTTYLGVGFDFALLGNRLAVSADFYEERTGDLLNLRNEGAFSGLRYRYENAGEIRNRGVEAEVSANLFQKGKFHWTLGATIGAYRSEVRNLGEAAVRTIELGDGVQLISRVGEAPNAFYGHRFEKVFASSEEAAAAGLSTGNGKAFAAGDALFYDLNGDHIIDERDRIILGDPNPDFFGGFYSFMRYGNFGLFLNFAYSYGNDVYNGVRRATSSLKELVNQATVAERRWTTEGQVTDVPRAAYGDPKGNSRFSSRWIEDGSYLRLKEVTLSYEYPKRLWLFNSLKLYATGENLLTFTKYLGYDPESNYSNAAEMIGMDLGKAPHMRGGRIGLILNF